MNSIGKQEKRIIVRMVDVYFVNFSFNLNMYFEKTPIFNREKPVY